MILSYPYIDGGLSSGLLVLPFVQRFLGEGLLLPGYFGELPPHIPSFAFFLVHKAASICEHLKVWVLQWLVHQFGMAGIDWFNYLNTIMHKLFSIIWEQSGRMQDGGCFESNNRIIQ